MVFARAKRKIRSCILQLGREAHYHGDLRRESQAKRYQRMEGHGYHQQVKQNYRFRNSSRKEKQEANT